MNLPPDPDQMNSQRAGWAEDALFAFQRVTGTDHEDMVADLLGNLMHWADRNDIDFGAELARGRAMYEDEIRSET